MALHRRSAAGGRSAHNNTFRCKSHCEKHLTIKHTNDDPCLEDRELLFYRFQKYCTGRVHGSIGSLYSCFSEDLIEYHGKYPPPRATRWRAIPSDSAADRLVAFLDQGPDRRARDAIGRLNEGLHRPDWGPDLVIKAFRDLDIVFFDEQLSGNVVIKWLDEKDLAREKGTPVEGVRRLFGFSHDLGHGQSQIYLNARSHMFSRFHPFKQMWRTVIHEMTHVWQHIMSGHEILKPIEKEAKWSHGHGPNFRKSIRAIDARSREYLGLNVNNPCKYNRYTY